MAINGINNNQSNISSLYNSIFGIGSNSDSGSSYGISDLAMIRKAGIGAAMANAQLQVKQEADYVLPYTNEEDGVAWLLEEIIRQQEKNGRECG